MFFSSVAQSCLTLCAPAGWLLKKGGLSCRMSLRSAAAVAGVRLRELRNCQRRTPRKALQLQIGFAPAPELRSTVRFLFA